MTLNLLFETIKKNNYKVLKNKSSIKLGDYSGLISDEEAVKLAKETSNFKLYTNSEDSIEWIMNNLKDIKHLLI